MNIHNSQDCKGIGRPIITPFYHFQLIHEHLDISEVIPLDISHLHVARDQT